MKFKSYRKKSPWILHYNAGSCNGCDIEILACLAPKYDIERFGMINTGNPKQSDILLVEIYAQMPEPKVVISCGACASSGGVFRGMYNCEGGIDQYIPVDVYVCGCGCRPEQIIDGVVQALGILEQKTKELEESVKLKKKALKEEGQLNRREIATEIKTALS